MYSRFIADFTCNKSRAESIGWLNGYNPKGVGEKIIADGVLSPGPVEV